MSVSWGQFACRGQVACQGANVDGGDSSVIVAVTGDDDEDSLLVREREYCRVEALGGKRESLVLKERRVGDGVGCVDSSPGWERRGCLLRTVFATVRVRCSKTRSEW